MIKLKNILSEKFEVGKVYPNPYHTAFKSEEQIKKESVNEVIDGLKNAQSRLKKVYKHLGVEYGQTRRGDKYVQINYIPKSAPQSQQPEWVKVFYDSDEELQKIGKTLKLKLKESVNEADDHEVGMGLSALKESVRSAKVIYDEIKKRNIQELEGWVQHKLTLASDYLNTVAQYMEDLDEYDEKDKE